MLPPPPSPGPAQGSPAPQSWTHGTLTYSLGGLLLLFAWLLLGDFAIYLRDRSIVPITQLFLKREGASDTLIAVMLFSLPALLGIVLGPIVSCYSDRHRGPWGRRIPYLLVSAPLAALAMAGLAFCAPLGSAIHAAAGDAVPRETAVLVIFGVLWTIFGAASVVSMTVFNGLINDVVPSAVLGRFFGLFRAVSIADAVIFNYFLLGWAETHFMQLCLAISIVFGAGFLLMCLNVREGEYPPAEQPPRAAGRGGSLAEGARLYFRECYSKPYYLLCFLCIALGPLAFLAVTSFDLLYAKQMGMEMAQLGKIKAYCAIIALAITYPTGILADKWHPLRAAMAAMAAHAVATGLGTAMIRDAGSFTFFLVAQSVISSCYYTATASLPQRLLPRSKFLQFFSAANIVTALCSVGFGPVLGTLLDASGNQYRLTFLASALLSGVTLLLLALLWKEFLKLGGPSGYTAPGDTRAPSGPGRAT
jgi:MFS family permease